MPSIASTLATSSRVCRLLTFKLPTAEQLRNRASAMPDESSTGPDGRAPVELKRLPLWLWEVFAKFWECVFLKGGGVA